VKEREHKMLIGIQLKYARPLLDTVSTGISTASHAEESDDAKLTKDQPIRDMLYIRIRLAPLDFMG